MKRKSMGEKVIRNNVQSFWDLSSPKMCRDFLKQVRLGPPPGKAIEYLQQQDGKQITIDDASDEQILNLTKEIAEAFGVNKKGRTR